MTDKNLIILNRIFFMIFSLISLVFYTFGQQFIPPLFNQDSGTIRLAMFGDIKGAYGATADFYKFIGFKSNSSELSVEIFSWLVYIISLIVIFRICRGNIVSFIKLILVTGYTIAFGFYYATYSKDIILILFLLVISIIFLKKEIYYHIPIILFIYGYFFRQYWIIVSIMILLIILMNLKKINPLIVFISTLFVIYGYEFMTGLYITDTRVDVNAGRIANTMINNLTPNTSFFTDVLNYLYVLISMFFPIQGIKSSNGLIYYLWIWFILIIFIIERKKLNKKMTYLLLIYISVQACFEPDFGSAIRHMIPLIFIVFISLYRNDIKENKEKV